MEEGVLRLQAEQQAASSSEHTMPPPESMVE